MQDQRQSLSHPVNIALEEGISSMSSDNGSPRIVASDVIDANARAMLAKAAEIVDVDGTDLKALLAVPPRDDALIVRSETQVGTEVLAKLRVVTCAGVGTDNIDVVSATAAGILVLDAPPSTLPLIRSIPDANQSTHAGLKERNRFKALDLNGKTIGIRRKTSRGDVQELGHMQRTACQELLVVAEETIELTPVGQCRKGGAQTSLGDNDGGGQVAARWERSGNSHPRRHTLWSERCRRRAWSGSVS